MFARASGLLASPGRLGVFDPESRCKQAADALTIPTITLALYHFPTYLLTQVPKHGTAPRYVSTVLECFSISLCRFENQDMTEGPFGFVGMLSILAVLDSAHRSSAKTGLLHKADLIPGRAPG